MYANWIGEITTTTGSGPITVGGAIEGYIEFEEYGNDDYWYAILDGSNRECGKGTFTNGTFFRTTVDCTLVDGTFNKTSPTAIDLSGNATIFCTLNAETLDEGTSVFPEAPVDGFPYCRQDGTWVIAPTGNISNADAALLTGGGNTTLHSHAGISANLSDYISRNLGPNEPIFLVAIGQSLTTPYPVLQTDVINPLPSIASNANSAIKEWCSNGLGDPNAPYPGDDFGAYTSVTWEQPAGVVKTYGCGRGSGNGAPTDFLWRTLDINKTQVQDFTGGPYVGFTGNGATNHIHGFAVQLHEWTGRDVYILNINWSAHHLSPFFWPFANPSDTEVTVRDPLDPVDTTVQVGEGGMGWQSLIDNLESCITSGQAIDSNFPDKPTFFFTQTGASDYGPLDFDELEYFEYYFDMDREIERNNRLSPNTPRIFFDFSSAQQTPALNKWNIYRTCVSLLDRPTTLIPMNYPVWDGVHPSGEENFNVGYSNAGLLADFVNSKDMPGGSRLLRRKEIVVTYGDWLSPNNNSASLNYAINTNVAGDILRIPYTMLDAFSGGSAKLTHVEQYGPANLAIRISRLNNSTGVPTGDFAHYLPTGQATWGPPSASLKPTDAPGTPNHLAFPVELVSGYQGGSSPSTWNNFDKIKVEYRQIFPLFASTGNAPLGTKNSSVIDSGGLETNVPARFTKDFEIQVLDKQTNLTLPSDPLFGEQIAQGSNDPDGPVITQSIEPQFNMDRKGLMITQTLKFHERRKITIDWVQDGLYPTDNSSGLSLQDPFCIFRPRNILVLNPNNGNYEPTSPNTYHAAIFEGTMKLTGYRIDPAQDTGQGAVPDDAFYSQSEDFLIQSLGPSIVDFPKVHVRGPYRTVNPGNQTFTQPNILGGGNKLIYEGGYFGNGWAIHGFAESSEKWVWRLEIDMEYTEI